METLAFLTEDQARQARQTLGTPVFVYDQKTIERRAKEVLAFPHAYGFTARFAMKALPTSAIVKLFNSLGLHIDASSAHEAERAMRAGVSPDHIQLTAQQLPDDLAGLVNKGVLFNACSLHQLEAYGVAFPGTNVCVRINPGLGSGHSHRTNVGGPASSFGIWHERVDDILAIARKHNLQINAMHTHIGSGTDPEVWVTCAKMSLDIAAKLPEVSRLSLGGGFKVARMPDEKTADLQEIGGRIVVEFEHFAQQYHRNLHLEIEPGTYLAANCGALVTTAIDIVSTGPEGYDFIKLDSGMTEILRPSLYGAQHPITVVPAAAGTRAPHDYIVVGHCCESGDILTPEPGNPEGLKKRTLTEAAIGDLVVIDGAGAYCSGMPSKNYNSFPECAEALLTSAGEFKKIRNRQTLDQMLQNEVLT